MGVNTVFISLGSNINPRLDYLQYAEKQIGNRAGTIISKSSVYETEAWGFESNNAFYNNILLVETNLTANNLLKELLLIEKESGRIRRNSGRYTDRTLDADILYFNDEIINSDNLIVPHPRLHLRKFVLEPLNEIASDFIHPLLKLTSSELLSNCKDKSIVRKINEL